MGKTASVLVALPMLLALTGSAFAPGGITDLGRPTNDIPPHSALGAFRRFGTSLSQHGKPQLLFIGTQIDQGSAAERWPVIKALEQFGTLAGVRAAETRSCVLVSGGPSSIQCGRTGYPTFDWERARFVSRYLVFVHRDLIDSDLRMRQRLPATDLALFDRYVVPPRYQAASFHDRVWHSATDGAGDSQFPLLGVENYVEAGANVATPGDMAPATSTAPLPFSTIQRSLQQGKPIGNAPQSLVPDYNAEANVITALICHADHLQPRAVCGRSSIRSILKHVK